MTRRELREALPLLPSESEEAEVQVFVGTKDRTEYFWLTDVQNWYGKTVLFAEPVKHEKP